MSLTHFGVGHSNTPLTFSSFIFIPSGPITTPRNPILIFHLHFSSFIYKSFSCNLFTTSTTNSSCLSSSSVSIITSSINAAIFPIFIKSLSNLFIIAWKVTSEFANPKNMTVGSKYSSGVMDAAFYSSPSLILTLLQPHLKSIFVNTFLVPIFLIMSEISSSGQLFFTVHSLRY